MYPIMIFITLQRLSPALRWQEEQNRENFWMVLERIISTVLEMDDHILHELPVQEQDAGIPPVPWTCLLTCSWVLVNIQGALTWKNRLGSTTKVPISPKKLEVVIFQEQLTNLPRPCKCNKCSRLPLRAPPPWPWQGPSNLLVSDCSEVTNDGLS